MPKILARDPAWLSRSTPAARLFQADKSAVKTENDGASRKIAHRGSEVFVTVGTELRWSNLGVLKDAGEQSERQQARDGQADGEMLYRVCEICTAGRRCMVC